MKRQPLEPNAGVSAGAVDPVQPAAVAPEPAFASRPDSTIFSQLLKDPAARASTLIVFACTFWQVFALGFYLDDWSFMANSVHMGAAFSSVRWAAAYESTPQRPGATLLWFGLTSLFGAETILWHLALFAANVLLGLLMFRIVRQLAGRSYSFETARVLYLSVLLWFVLPWNAPLHFWPTMVPILLILGLSVCCFLFALWRWATGGWAFWLPFAGYLWACVGYEAVYFQWIPVLLLGVILVWDERASLKSVLLGASPFVAAQACALIWYAASLRVNLGTQHKITADWPAVFKGNMLHLPREILASTPETARLLSYAAVVSLLMIAGTYGYAILGSRTRKSALVSLSQLGACLIGAVLSIFAFSLGGRQITGVGVDARAFLLLNFWLVIAVALALTYCWTYYSAHRGRWQTPVLGLAFLLAGLALLVGHLQRALDWSEGWRIEQKILAEAPIPEMKKMEPDAAVLVLKPFEFHGVPTLTQSWDVNAAMWNTHPAVFPHHFEVYNPWGGPLRWDGNRLWYPASTLWVARNLYVWRPMEREFYKMTVPFRVNQDLSLVTTGR